MGWEKSLEGVWKLKARIVPLENIDKKKFGREIFKWEDNIKIVFSKVCSPK